MGPEDALVDFIFVYMQAPLLTEKWELVLLTFLQCSKNLTE